MSNQSNPLTHPVWTFIGVVVAVVFGIAGLWLTLRQQSPNTTDHPPTNTTLLNVNDRKATPTPTLIAATNLTPTDKGTPAPTNLPTDVQESPSPTATRTPLIIQPSPSGTPQVPYEPGDIGETKDNGYYELTLENAKVSYTSKNCFSGFVDVSSDQKMVAVTFSIRALSLQVPSISTSQDVRAYYLLDPQQRRFEMSCGDGRYFNVSLNSFEGKPKAKTLTVEFLVPRNAQKLRFRFSSGTGNPLVFNLPNSI